MGISRVCREDTTTDSPSITEPNQQLRMTRAMKTCHSHSSQLLDRTGESAVLPPHTNVAYHWRNGVHHFTCAFTPHPLPHWSWRLPHFKHLMQYDDCRFSRHPRIRFFAFIALNTTCSADCTQEMVSCL